MKSIGECLDEPQPVVITGVQKENRIKFEQRASGKLAYTLELNFPQITEKEIELARQIVDKLEEKFKDILIDRKGL